MEKSEPFKLTKDITKARKGGGCCGNCTPAKDKQTVLPRKIDQWKELNFRVSFSGKADSGKKQAVQSIFNTQVEYENAGKEIDPIHFHIIKD